jgi:tetratricopeptide (TPR) repeat protein
MRLLLFTVFSALFAFGQSPAPWITLAKLAEQSTNVEDYAGAEKLCREALRSAEQQLGMDNKHLVLVLAQLGGSLHAQARDGEAEVLAHRALAIANASEDPKMMGIALNFLGVILSSQGEVARSEPLMRRSLALLEQAEGTETLDTAKAINNLATFYARIREYGKAEQQMTRALPVYEKIFGPEHPEFAIALGNMFVIVFEQRRVAEAEPFLRRALAIGEAKFPRSGKMAHLRSFEAALEASRGNFKRSARLMEEVIAIQERVLGPEHPLLAKSLVQYSEVLRRLHQKSEAKLAQNRANTILKSFH